MKRLMVFFLMGLLISCSSVKNDIPNDTYKKNVKIFVENDPDNQVYIFESRVSKDTLDKVNVLNGVKINNISKSEKGEDNKDHSELVVKAFADNNLDFRVNSNDELDGRRINVNLASYKDFELRDNVKGIISMSYGNTVYNNNMKILNDNAIYFDKPLYKNFSDNFLYRDYFIDDFSNALFDEDYKENRQLKIKSLGNEGDEGIKDYVTTSQAHTLYQVLSPEMQKLARSEIIQVKNMYNSRGVVKFDLESITNLEHKNNFVVLENGNKYYEVEKRGYNSKPFLLRSNTVVDPGFIDGRTGSSFSAPHIARLAYEIKRKYPFLTYNQVKQIILTTSDSDGSGYLSDIIGWGVANKEKALKGFGSFNAGLIEEMKFFEDNSKIFERDDKGKINFYEYLNIPKGSYTFENNIGGGLKGDGNNNENIYYTFKGKQQSSGDVEENFDIRLPKVLDSEKNYYDNIASAGLRKDGKGELVLSGRQEYKGKTQVLDGTLVLKNDSLSKYEIFENGKLKLDGNHIEIKNDIISDGVVEFSSNKTSFKNYKASGKSETILHTDKKVIVDRFDVSGKLRIDFGEVFNLDGTNIVESKNIDISKAEITNLFLKKDMILNNKLTENNIWRSLKDLSQDELRNIPSYDINKKKFFKSFVKEGSYYPDLFSNLLNVSSDDKEKTISQLFTDNYTSFVTNLFEISDNVYSNQGINLLDINNKNISFYYNSGIVTNLFKKADYIPFSNKLISNIIGSDLYFNNNLKLGAFLGNHNNTLIFENDGEFNSKNYQIGIKILYNKEALMISNTSSYMYSNSDVNRTVNSENKKTNIKSNLILNNLDLGYLFSVDNTRILPSLNFGIQSLGISKFKEEGKKLNIEINDNKITKFKIGASLDVLTSLNKNLDLINNLKVSTYLNEDVVLKGKIDGLETEFYGKKLDKYLIEYKTGLNFRKNNFGINMNIGINNQSNIKAEFKIKYEI